MTSKHSSPPGFGNCWFFIFLWQLYRGIIGIQETAHSKVCNWMSFDVDTPKKPLPQWRQWTYTSTTPKSSLVPPALPPFYLSLPPTPQPWLCFLSLFIGLHVLEFYVNRILLYALSCLASFTQHNDFEVHLLLLSIVPLCAWTTVPGDGRLGWVLGFGHD